jgi:pyruvate-ferredoxin/flavodoxin oxidoreductase
VARGDKVGLLKMRLFRPLAVEAALLAAIPASVTAAVAVLDRCKEPGAEWRAALQGRGDGASPKPRPTARRPMPRVIGGRYGLASKEFTPRHGPAAVFDAAGCRHHPRRQFTVGIVDDVTHLSLDWDAAFRSDASRRQQHAVFWGPRRRRHRVGQ